MITRYYQFRIYHSPTKKTVSGVVSRRSWLPQPDRAFASAIGHAMEVASMNERRVVNMDEFVFRGFYRVT